MSTVNAEKRGKPLLPAADPPVFRKQEATPEKAKSSSATLKYDPLRRESRQQPSPSSAEALSAQSRNSAAVKKPGETRGLALRNGAPANHAGSASSRLLPHSVKSSSGVPVQRRLSDPQMPNTHQALPKTAGSAGGPFHEPSTELRQGAEKEIETILSSADAPPGFLAKQLTPSPPVTVEVRAPSRVRNSEVLTGQEHGSMAQPRPSDPNPLTQVSLTSNQNGPGDGTKLTAPIPLEAIETADPDWQRENEWLQVPILFYFFAALIEFRELQENYLLDGQFTDSAQEQLMQLHTVSNRISYSVDEIDGILLNRAFAHWSDAALRKRVQDVVTEWTNGGPRSEGFRDASLALIDDISEDRPCTIRYTQFYVFRQYLGGKGHYHVTLAVATVLLVVCLACIVLMGVFGRKHLVACIVLAAVLGVAVIIGYVLMLLLLHHNYYADSAEKFFRAQSLSVTKDDINEDDDSMDNLWLGPLAGLPGPSSGGGTLNNHSLDNHRQDAVNALRMSPLNYTTNEMNVSQLQAQFVRQSISHSDGDIRSASIDSLMGNNSSQQIVNSLTENISITALVYSNNRDLVETIALTLWKNNFYVFSSTDLTALDAAYHRGSERFKVMLISARELGTNGNRLKTVLDWVEERRPVFFFCDADSGFPELLPVNARVHVPLTAVDVRRVLLAGIAVSEEDTQMRDGANCDVPNYTLGRRLGGGAFGNVFEAQLEGTGAKCAVKRMYLKESADDAAGSEEGPSKQLRDIAQEVEIMSSLTHPNIVQYLFCQRDDNCISIFMELCSGGSLSSMIKRGDIDDAGTIKRVLTEIIRAVAYLHNKRIVHRDLKPDNVLFRNDHAKVTDFGTAVHKRGDLNIVTGTFAYMAPEILVGDTYGKECDIWSVGCVAAEMLSIDLPQRGMGPPEMGTFYRQMAMESALEINCDKPDVVHFLQACLQRNPANRATANSLLSYRMLSKESNDIAEWLVEVRQRKKLKRQQSGVLTHNPSFDLDSSVMTLDSNQ